jgi:hypothetical protein
VLPLLLLLYSLFSLHSARSRRNGLAGGSARGVWSGLVFAFGMAWLCDAGKRETLGFWERTNEPAAIAFGIWAGPRACPSILEWYTQMMECMLLVYSVLGLHVLTCLHTEHACFYCLASHRYPTLPPFLPVLHSFSLSLCSVSLSRKLRHVSLFCPFNPPCPVYLVPSLALFLRRRFPRRIPGVHQPLFLYPSRSSTGACIGVCARQQKKSARPPRTMIDSPGNHPSILLSFGVFSAPPRPSDIRQLIYSPAGFIALTACNGRSYGLLRMPSKLPVGAS